MTAQKIDRQNVSKPLVCNDSRDTLRLGATPCDSVRHGAASRFGSVAGAREIAVIVRVMRDLYFVRNSALGFIKIGVTADITKRLRSLESACGMPLELLRHVPDAGGEEYWLLQIFQASRLKGEWFRPTPELLELATTDADVSAFVAGWVAAESEREWSERRDKAEMEALNA